MFPVDDQQQQQQQQQQQPQPFTTERALLRAVSSRRVEEARRLMAQVQDLYYDSYKQDKRTADPHSGTVIHALAYVGISSLVEELSTKYGFDINVGRKFDQATALHIACLHGNTEVVEVLLKLNADMLRTATGDRGVVGYAFGGPRGDREAILDLLKNHAISVYGEHKAKEAIRFAAHATGNRRLQPPLLIAASFVCEAGVELLVWAGEDPDYVGHQGRTALLWVATGVAFDLAGGIRAHETIGSPDQMATAIGALLKNGADPNARVVSYSSRDGDDVGMTALHLLASNRISEKWILPSCVVLLENGAQPLLLDGNGRSVMAVAVQKQRPGLVEILEAVQANKKIELPAVLGLDSNFDEPRIQVAGASDDEQASDSGEEEKAYVGYVT